jgi:ribonuclease VapC
VTIFVDASALVAIISGEATADALAEIIEKHPHPLVSALSLWETVAGLCRSYSFPLPTADAYVEDFSHTHGFRAVDIGERELRLAIEAYSRYGKGRHAAALNMGDCFAYACAKANRARLLYVGDDFAKTDLA